MAMWVDSLRVQPSGCNRKYPSGYGKILFTENTIFTVWWTNYFYSSLCRFCLFVFFSLFVMDLPFWSFISLSLHQVRTFKWMKIFLKTGFVGFWSFSELSRGSLNANAEKARKFMKSWSQNGKIVNLRAANK